MPGNGDPEGTANDLGEQYGGPSGSPKPISGRPGVKIYPNDVLVRPGSSTDDGRPRVSLPAGVGGSYPENIHIND